MRILSLAPANTEILYALGLGRHIVGVTNLCDFPVAAKKKEKIGTWTSTTPDDIRALRPDLIFTSYYLPPELREYEGPGELIHLAPRTLGDVLASIIEIGRLTGTVDVARNLTRSMEEQFDVIQKRTDHSAQRPRIYAEEWGNPPMVSGNWVPQLIGIAGGREVISGPGEQSRSVTLDEVAEADPDMIIVHWCGAGPSSRVDAVTKRPGWNTLRAVREARVFAIHDSMLNRPGPRLVDGVRKMHEVVVRRRP